MVGWSAAKARGRRNEVGATAKSTSLQAAEPHWKGSRVNDLADGKSLANAHGLVPRPLLPTPKKSRPLRPRLMKPWPPK